MTRLVAGDTRPVAGLNAEMWLKYYARSVIEGADENVHAVLIGERRGVDSPEVRIWVGQECNHCHLVMNIQKKLKAGALMW